MSTFVSSSSESSKQYKIISQDSTSFEISQEVTEFSTALVEMIRMNKGNEDEDEDEEEQCNTFTFPNISGVTLESVVEFLNHCVVEPMNPIPRKPIKSAKLGEVVQEWYCEYITGKGIQQVCKITNAAEFLGIQTLLDLCCAHLACLIKPKDDALGIAELFGIEGLTFSTFSKEEEKKIREENKWIDLESCEL
jgi:hypothetical protein